MTGHPTHSARRFAKQLAAVAKTGSPLRYARGVVVSSNIGQTVITLDGGATNVTAFNPGHIQSVPAGTVVDVRLQGNPTQAYIVAAYGVDRPSCRVYRNAAYTMTVGADTKLPFDTVTFDTASGFSTGTNLYTAPAAGIYLVTVKIGQTTSVDTDETTARIYKNGALYSTAGFDAGGSHGSWSQVTDTVQCVAGDTLGGYYNTAHAFTLAVGSTNTSMSIVKVSN